MMVPAWRSTWRERGTEQGRKRGREEGREGGTGSSYGWANNDKLMHVQRRHQHRHRHQHQHQQEASDLSSGMRMVAVPSGFCRSCLVMGEKKLGEEEEYEASRMAKSQSVARGSDSGVDREGS